MVDAHHLYVGLMDGAIFKLTLNHEGLISDTQMIYKSRPRSPDTFAVLDINTDYRHRVLFADQNGNVRVCQDNFVEVINSQIIGSFGKCIRLTPSLDHMYVVKEGFHLVEIDLTSPQFKVKETHAVGEDHNLLADWSIDFKRSIGFFLLNTGTIVIYDIREKKKSFFKVEEKWGLGLSKDGRNFTAMCLNHSSKLLGVAAIVNHKDKKSNSIYVYKPEVDAKREVRLALLAQTSVENVWEGSSSG